MRIIWPFVAIVALLLVLAGASLSVMSALRAYVGGESAWSRAQKSSCRRASQIANAKSPTSRPGHACPQRS